MSDITASSPAAHPLNRLADKIKGMVPQASPSAGVQPGGALSGVVPEGFARRPSPAVEAALKRSARRAAGIVRASHNTGPLPVRVVESFVSACAFVPYAAVALVVRLVIARVFFLAGQTMIEGPRIAFSMPDALSQFGWRFDTAVTLPAGVRPETFAAFANEFSTVPLPSVLGAWLVSYAQFVLPILLVLGLATRASALGLLIITAMIQLFVFPDALWTTHIYWFALLAMLMAMGPGSVSLDHMIRWVARR